MRTIRIISLLLLPLSALAIPLSTSSDNVNSYQRRGGPGGPVASLSDLSENSGAIVAASDKKIASPEVAPKIESEAPISPKNDIGSPGPIPEELAKPPTEVKPGIVQRLKDAWNAGRAKFAAVIADLKATWDDYKRPVVQNWLDKIEEANTKVWMEKADKIYAKGAKFKAAQDAQFAKFFAAQEAKKTKFTASQNAAFAKNADFHEATQDWVYKMGQKHGTLGPDTPLTPASPDSPVSGYSF